MEQRLFLLLNETAAALVAGDAPRKSAATDYHGFRTRVERLTDHAIDAMFPHRAQQKHLRATHLSQCVELLEQCLARVLCPARQPEDIVAAVLRALPELQRQLQTDLDAAYEGDPAARSRDEVLLCYPSFTAISIYRLSHVLYLQGVPLLPRIMTEYAHRQTGIDIHPGASIGDYFFIDHGSGVVIGETASIGHHVKLYQHVTLGAKSFPVGENGVLVKSVKRHPDIGDRVVIYAGATILGGKTVVGDDCVIGGNVWLTHSVPPGKLVLAKAASTGELTRDRLPHSAAP